jgi:hypothetical protein
LYLSHPDSLKYAFLRFRAGMAVMLYLTGSPGTYTSDTNGGIALVHAVGCCCLLLHGSTRMEFAA